MQILLTFLAFRKGLEAKNKKARSPLKAKEITTYLSWTYHVIQGVPFDLMNNWQVTVIQTWGLAVINLGRKNEHADKRDQKWEKGEVLLLVLRKQSRCVLPLYGGSHRARRWDRLTAQSGPRPTASKQQRNGDFSVTTIRNWKFLKRNL